MNTIAINSLTSKLIKSAILNADSTDFAASSILEGAFKRNGIDVTNLPHGYVLDGNDSAIEIDDFYNPTYININPADPISTSHELGHVGDLKNTKSKYIYGILDNLPVLHNISKLIREARANRLSWKAISNEYKDNPSILKQFGDLRSKSLTKAYMTYLAAAGTPLVGATLGGILGAYILAKKTSKAAEDDSDLYKLSRKNRDKIKKRRKLIGTLLGGITGGGAGIYIGNNFGKYLSIPLNILANNSLIKNDSSPEYVSSLRRLNLDILKHFKKNK